MEKADPCARSGVISFGSCSLPQILGTNGLVVVVVVVYMVYPYSSNISLLIKIVNQVTTLYINNVSKWILNFSCYQYLDG